MNDVEFESARLWLPQSKPNVFDSTDEAQEFISGMLVDHDLRVLSPRQDFRFTAKTFWFGDIGLIYLSYDTHVQISPAPLEGFVLAQIPLAGTSTLKIGSQSIESSPLQATLPPQDQPSIMQWYPKAPHLCVYVKQERLEEMARQVYGLGEVENLKLRPALDLQTNQGKRFKQAILDFHQDVHEVELPRMAKLTEEVVIGRLLAASRNSVNDALDSWSSKAALAVPKKRNLAKDFEQLVQKHFAEDVSVADFAERLNVSIRALQLAVSDEFSSTPSGLLIDERLNQARKKLLDPRLRQASISELAIQSGFNHQGRFTSFYKAKFGETPGQTRSKS